MACRLPATRRVGEQQRMRATGGTGDNVTQLATGVLVSLRSTPPAAGPRAFEMPTLEVVRSAIPFHSLALVQTNPTE
jgi:hypothetical protein